MTDADLEKVVRNVALPALMNPNYDIQDSASELLSFLLKCSEHLRTLIPEFGGLFKKWIFSGTAESLPLKLSGVKGLSAIIHSTVLFDTVPDEVFDAFVALSKAQSMDSVLDSMISLTFTDFWSVHEENLMPEVAEVLRPFRDSIRPGYLA
jgi:hypothetical protein